MTTERVARRAVVSGRVQGVGFRFYARAEAERLGLSGFVQNQGDGSLLVEAAGEPAAVHEFIGWLRSGPPSAEVGGVDVRPIEAAAGEGFTIR
jgi:acylphosphatase